MDDLPTRLRDCYCPDDLDEATCRVAADTIEHLRRMLGRSAADEAEIERIAARIDQAKEELYPGQP